MICPKCSSEQTGVITTSQKGRTRRRRYKCLSCGERFNTVECYFEKAGVTDTNVGSKKERRPISDLSRSRISMHEKSQEPGFDQRIADAMKDTCAFSSAQHKAEREGRSEFDCPLCGGTARWSRAKFNNHLWSGCEKCGFRMME